MTPKVSVEFFPPRTAEIQARIDECIAAFDKYAPEYYSVTSGAGGSTLTETGNIVKHINAKSGISVAPHLTCIGSKKSDICTLLDQYKSEGINHIVALRGDMPSGMRDPGELNHANELVSLIRSHWGKDVQISVAAYPECHPEAKSPDIDFENFKRKAQAGANSAITQYFFNAAAYYDFLERCHKNGISTPITPGIMPITNFKQISRFSEMCGAELPRWISKRLEAYDKADDKASLKAFGADVVSKMCEDLIKNGVPSLHFYCLNRHEAVSNILDNIL